MRGDDAVANAVFAAFGSALCDNTSLVNLNLAHNRLGSRGTLAEALSRNQTLRSLGLWDTPLGDAGCATVVAALATNATLATLDISHTGSGLETAKRIASALDINRVLSCIHLSFVDPEAAVVVCRALKANSTLTTLTIWNTEILPSALSALTFDTPRSFARSL